jgi:hypothetical protein
MHASRVFIPQLPSKFDRDINRWVPNVNTAAAAKFGELVIMVPPEASRLSIMEQIELVNDAMMDFNEQDWYVALGDPTFISIVAYIAGTRTRGRMRMLKWDKQTADYLPIDTVVKVAA